jgi:hypothetical protein
MSSGFCPRKMKYEGTGMGVRVLMDFPKKSSGIWEDSCCMPPFFHNEEKEFGTYSRSQGQEEWVERQTELSMTGQEFPAWPKWVLMRKRERKPERESERARERTETDWFPKTEITPGWR